MKLLALLLVLSGAAAASAAEKRSVTLDVKDEDVRIILKSMQKQCGIKNLLIDKEVQGAGTIYFREVPCEQAFRTVFRPFGLTGQIASSVTHVEPRQ